MRALLVVLGATALLASGGAARAEKVTAAESKARALLAEVAKATEAKDAQAGAKAVAELAVLAVKEKSLDAEERAADAYEALLDALDDEAPATGATVAKAGPREALASVMKALDPARHGVFLSAHALAAELVLQAGERGDTSHLEDARSVLAAYAATPKCGKAGPAMLALADGIGAARAGATDAPTGLATAGSRLQVGGWLRPGLVCAFERLALHAAAGDVAAGEKVVAEISARIDPERHADLARAWRSATSKRIQALPETLRVALEKVLAPFRAGLGGAGGRGSDGGAGPGSKSPLGKAWPRLAGKPIVTAKRTPAGFTVQPAYDKAPGGEHPAGDGQKHWDKDGITLAFADGAAAVLMLDLVGNRGQPGERPQPSVVRAWYRLAPGETYEARVTGVVIHEG